MVQQNKPRNRWRLVAIGAVVLVVLGLPTAWGLDRGSWRVGQGNKVESQQPSEPGCLSHESRYVNQKGRYAFCYDSTKWFVVSDADRGRPDDVYFGQYKFLDTHGVGGIAVLSWEGTVEESIEEMKRQEPVNIGSQEPLTIAGSTGIQMTIQYATGEGWDIRLPWTRGKLLHLGLASHLPEDQQQWQRMLQTLTRI